MPYVISGCVGDVGNIKFGGAGRVMWFVGLRYCNMSSVVSGCAGALYVTYIALGLRLVD